MTYHLSLIPKLSRINLKSAILLRKKLLNLFYYHAETGIKKSIIFYLAKQHYFIVKHHKIIRMLLLCPNGLRIFLENAEFADRTGRYR